MPQIRTAFLSVYNKDGVEVLALRLVERGVEIWASSGTADYLNYHKIPSRSVDELTGFRELLGGRVKTLHPSVFSAILARPGENDIQQMKKEGLPIFDLVFVDLYPFVTALREGRDSSELVDLIDIGGVALLRASAKNYKRVVSVYSIEGLENVLNSMEDNNFVSEEFSKRMAYRTFFFTSYYDSAIAHWLWNGDDFPEYFSVAGAREDLYELRYGENPHQKAMIYRMPGLLSGIVSSKFLSGKSLSYNNVLDADSALSILLEFDKPACVIVKHNSPCGVAVCDAVMDAYNRAFECDPGSAFGGIVAFNSSVDDELAKVLVRHFFEIVIAPGYTDGSLEILRTKKNLRIIEFKESKMMPPFEFRSVDGGMLVESINPPGKVSGKWEVVSRYTPTPEQELDMCFAMKVCKYVRSNAIVIARDNATVGIGGGQPSRVDSARIAVWKAQDKTKGSVAASDGFLPFPDTLEVLAMSGVKALIQPGGSKNDQQVIDKANELGLVMVFTGMRHFKH